MRITTLLLLSTIISTSLIAQEKGDKLIGGSLSFTKAKGIPIYDTSSKYTSVNFSPSIGKFYKTNRMAGINLYYSHTNYKGQPYKQNHYGAGFFLRQYQPLGKSFYLFAEEGINGRIGKRESRYLYGQSFMEEEKTQSVSLFFFPGLAYGINKRLQLELTLPQLISLEYSHTSNEVKDYPAQPKRDGKTFSLNTGFSQSGLGNLGFGAKWLLKS